MIFQRKGSDRKRYFFVQYEARIPIYSFGKELWRDVDPTVCFQRTNGEELAMRAGAIYDIVVTQPIPLDRVSVSAVDHHYCISGTCNGTSLVQSTKQLRKIAVAQFRHWLSQNEEYSKLFRRFRVLEDTTIDLFDPEDSD